MTTNLLTEEQPLKKPGVLSFEIDSKPPADWDEFVKQNTDCIFHFSRWGNILARGYHSCMLYASLREDRELVLGLSGIIFNFKFFKLFYSTVPYGGFIGNKEYLGRFLEELEKELKKRGIHQIRLTRVASYPFPDLPGYELRPAFQHLLDLQDFTPETLWRSHQKNTRRDAQKARKSGIVIREISSADDLKDYWNLYRLTMERNQSLRHYTWDLYKVIFEVLIRRHEATILFADYKNVPVAGVLLIFGTDRTYLLGSVAHPDFLKYCPNDLLYNAALEKTFERKLRYFDFMTSPREDEPLMRFKEKWAGKRLPFCILSKDLDPFRAWCWKALWRAAQSRLGILLLSWTRWGR